MVCENTQHMTHLDGSSYPLIQAGTFVVPRFGRLPLGSDVIVALAVIVEHQVRYRRCTQCEQYLDPTPVLDTQRFMQSSWDDPSQRLQQSGGMSAEKSFECRYLRSRACVPAEKVFHLSAAERRRM